jgi:hypothetical protein
MSRLVQIDIDYWLERLVIWLLWTGLPRHQAWLRLLLSPLQDVNERLMTLQATLIERYQWSGQTAVLERVLRNTFAGGAAKIWIVNVINTEELYLFNRYELGERVYSYGPDDSGFVQEYALSWDEDDRPEVVYGFRVEVASDLWATLTDADKATIKVLVNRFKLYAVNWQLIERI